MRLLYTTLLLLFCFPVLTNGQSRYMVQFCEKANTLRINGETVALSQDALDRRRQSGIALDIKDLPVADEAVAAVAAVEGVEITGRSRWFNAVFVKTDGREATLGELSLLDAVCNIEPLRTYHYSVEEEHPTPAAAQRITHGDEPHEDEVDLEALYGFSYNQVEMIRTTFLHNLGYTGHGMRIGILDSGFKGMDTIEPFQEHWAEGRILDYWNFHENDDSVFTKGSHGTWVTSCIGVDQDFTYIGTAPDASFYLYRTEVGEFERVVEEEYWVLAAERADSLGVDVINTSLGYYDFEGADSVFSHTYQQLDGNTTIITRAADVAASRGILVVVSAGNQGNNEWRYIGAPADADSILTVGSVDSERERSSFSSYGPTVDGRVKPNVMAQGSQPYVIATNGAVGQASGTSFSSPIMAGAVACLKQAFPDASVTELFKAVEMSASHYNNPTDSMGYGIPNFEIASRLLAGPPTVDEAQVLTAFPNPTSGSLTIWIEHSSTIGTQADLLLTDAIGRVIRTWSIELDQEMIQAETFNFESLAKGAYVLYLSTNDENEYLTRFVKD